MPLQGPPALWYTSEGMDQMDHEGPAESSMNDLISECHSSTKTGTKHLQRGASQPTATKPMKQETCWICTSCIARPSYSSSSSNLIEALNTRRYGKYYLGSSSTAHSKRCHVPPASILLARSRKCTHCATPHPTTKEEGSSTVADGVGQAV